MASLRDIRRRIRSTQSTKQIMHAMQLVSGSKFKRAQARLLQSRQVFEFLDGLLQRVLAAAGRPERAPRSRTSRAAAPPLAQHPLMRRLDGVPDALLIVTSDTGLAGSYNTNLIQLAESELRKETARRTQVSFIGKRGHRYFTKRGVQVMEAHLNLAGRPDLQKINAIGQGLLERFLRGEVSSVRLLYAKFVSPTVSRPTVIQWLPITFGDKQQATGDKDQQRAGVRSGQPGDSRTRKPANRPAGFIEYPVPYIFEPSPERVFEQLLPRWTMATFQLVLLEAFTSEHGARMIAMKNATDNAQELMDALTRQRNKIRQASITKEISEIVGTAEALK